MIEFAHSYAEARERFLDAAAAFAAASGRALALEHYAIDAQADLAIDAAHFAPREGRRLVIVTSGVHGIEGYAGNAVQRALLAGPLARLAADCGLVLVHAVNPWGMANHRRVDAGGVDLNRNFADEGDALYASDNSGYARLAALLAPRGPCRGGLAPRLEFLAHVLGAALRHGYAPLKQALLLGQYRFPDGLFYGGTEPRPGTRAFTRLFAALCARYDEILLADLHTGYGRRGEAQLLAAEADARDVSAAGRAAPQRAQGYAATGTLVDWCRRTAQRIRPGARFDGVVVELGTTGLAPWSQLADLRTIVRENQLARHGASDRATEDAVKTSFRELFCPADPGWRRAAVGAALAAIEALLAGRGWLGADGEARASHTAAHADPRRIAQS